MTSKTLIIVPSRERPTNAHRLLKRVQETAPAEVHITFALDEDDPTINDYPPNHTQVVEGGNMVKALNEIAEQSSILYDYLAFLGDDTLPHGDWYAKVIEALESEPNSIVYGNDLFHGKNLPTSVFMDSNIVRALGYMAPPNQKQIFVDNYWKALGEDLGTLIYLDDVIIEHLHPNFGKAPSDDSYELSNGPERWRHDEEAFITHLNGQYLKDLEKLR